MGKRYRQHNGQVEEAVERFYAAWNKRDVRALGQVLHPEVRWSTPVSVVGGGHRVGIEAVLEAAREVFETFPTATLELHQLRIDADRAHVRGSYVVPGAELEFLHLLRVQDARVAELSASMRADAFLRWAAVATRSESALGSDPA